MGRTVVVIGTERPDAGAVAAGVLERLGRDEQVERVVVVGPPAGEPSTAGNGRAARVTGLDPTSAMADLERVLAGATSVVYLGAPMAGASAPGALDGTGNVADVRAARAVLKAASAAGVPHVVVLSSAMVYGAWGNNAVPLTEDAPLRPVPGVAYAVALGEIERLVLEWRRANPAATAAVLRPTITVPRSAAPASPTADGRRTWLGASPWVPTRWRSGDVGPPKQYLLDDDLASAIDLARSRRLDGPFNVAPAGWISAEALPELAGPPPPVRVPPVVADALTAARLRRGGYPRAVASYLREPWVVASDRLRAAGWSPADTNEEAFVAAYAGGPFTSIDARRRRQLSLAAVGAAAGLVAAGIVVLARRRRRPD
ncbi:MAG: NAD(P)H-binding protein [Actinobacteria bacterium]|nr:NAD(P)H-binding protein [Actinomycetota bacterium]